MEQQRCGNCRFWKRDVLEPAFDNDSGMCRRRAPAPDSGEGRSCRWPYTPGTDWCGEWEALALVDDGEPYPESVDLAGP